MTNNERDRLIYEINNDVKWIKAWTVDHKQTHSRYIYYFITTFIAIGLSWFR